MILKLMVIMMISLCWDTVRSEPTNNFKWFIVSIVRVVLSEATYCHAGLLPTLFFNSDDVGDMFLQNGSSISVDFTV
jgi:hypothetical protein